MHIYLELCSEASYYPTLKADIFLVKSKAKAKTQSNVRNGNYVTSMQVNFNE